MRLISGNRDELDEYWKTWMKKSGDKSVVNEFSLFKILLIWMPSGRKTWQREGQAWGCAKPMGTSNQSRDPHGGPKAV